MQQIEIILYYIKKKADPSNLFGESRRKRANSSHLLHRPNKKADAANLVKPFQKFRNARYQKLNCEFFFFGIQGDLVCCGVLSGNRNFEGRIHPNTRANYLASPLLVIAYAIAGNVDIDFELEPIGKFSAVLSCERGFLASALHAARTWD